MTREEAINVLNDYDINFERHTAEEIAEAHEMAIKALQQQPSENEKIIRISKGTLKARTGKYVIYDVEWLKTHFNTTEAKIYGQPNEDCISRKAVLDGLANIAKAKSKSDAQKSLMGRVMFFTEHLPSVIPQPEKHTKERTETHECDCISREAVLDALHSHFADGFDGDKWWNSTHVLDAINKAPSVTPQPKTEGARGDIPLQQSVPKMPQPKTEEQQKTGHWIEHKHGGIEHIECSECGVWFLKAYLPRKSYCPNCGSCNGDMIKNIMRDITKTMSGGTK